MRSRTYPTSMSFSGSSKDRKMSVPPDPLKSDLFQVRTLSTIEEADTDFSASNALTFHITTRQLFMDELAEIPVLHAISDPIYRYFPLDPHDPNPAWDELF